MNWFKEQLEYIRDLDKDVVDYIDKYTNYSSRMINDSLRGRRSYISNLDKKLDEVIAKSPPALKSYTVFRLTRTVDYINQDGFVSKGYLSTTIDSEDLVRRWQEIKRHNNIYTILRITVPEGVQGLYVEGKNEYEILFRHNITLKLIKPQRELEYLTKKSEFVKIPTIDLLILQ